MRVFDLKINGIRNPVGFLFEELICSWQVESIDSKKQEWGLIEVSDQEDMSNIVFMKKDANLSSIATPIDMILNPYTRYYWRVTICNEHGIVTTSDISYYETGKLNESWKADWISTGVEDKFCPLFFHEFLLSKDIRRARLYICGLGLFEAYINGKKVGDEYLTPYINDYKTCLQYFTYDVKDLLQSENELSVILGNGWYKGRLIGGRFEWFGDRFALIAELRIEYNDGSIESIVTDENWQYKASDIEENDIYDGEIYNPYLWEGQTNRLISVSLLDMDKEKLCERYSLPVKVMEEIHVKSVIRTPLGETVLDFGQNFSGFVACHACLPKGTKVVLEYGELLQDGNFYRENYRTAKARYVFVSRGEEECFRPHFTYYGFRYVRITGWVGDLNKENFVGKVLYSDIDRTGYIETGNDKINRLYLNSLWGLKSNFIDMPTDCPQRDERLGWTGDAQVFAPTAAYHMDTRAFYDKYMRDLGFDQKRNNGMIPYCLPNLNPGNTSSVWGDAASFIPHVLYWYYGNTQALLRHYEVMKGWVDYITREDDQRGSRHLYDFGKHFGDWLALDGVSEQSLWGETDVYYIASVYYYASTCKTYEAAKILGKKQDAKKYMDLSEKIKKAIMNTYMSPAGHLCINTQTGYLLALRFGIYKDKTIVISDLKKRLQKDCFTMKGGFVGATSMCTVLADAGMVKEAYKYLLNEEFPSWLYAVNLGATTIWERWNSVLADGTISGTGMNSLNHYSYGAVMEFMYGHAAGIKPLEAGFTKVQIAPNPNKSLQWLKCSYKSVGGLYVVEWKWIEDQIFIHLEIPFNTEAVFKLPYVDKEDMVLESGIYDFTYEPDKQMIQKYTWDSSLGEIAKDQDAKQTLLEYLPQLKNLMESDDKESQAVTLRGLDDRMFLSVDTNTLESAYIGLTKYCE